MLFVVVVAGEFAAEKCLRVVYLQTGRRAFK
jgi:hypothetical protein